MFFSITIYQMVGIGVKTFWMSICQNCTSIVIETSPTNTAISGRSNKYWYAAPYPSSFHWHEGIKVLPWIVTPEATSRRTILSLFIGSVKTSNPNSNLLRRTLYAQCQNDQDCQWHTTAHACNGVVNSTSQMLLFRNAKYCPAPPGDSVTRKSIFDSLIAGCVPVIFAKASMSQYLWFFSKQELDEVAVFIPKQNIMEQQANFLELLREISPEELLRKQKAIERIAPTLQYAVVPAYVHPEKGDIWTPPIDDAVEVIISKMLDRKTIEPLDGFSGLNLIQQKCMQNDILQNHADYAGLVSGKSKGDQGKNIAERIWKANRCDLYNRTDGFIAPTFTIEW
ncbi:hypothetical protein EON65_00535 [archaeon]|nr:MAG: hypothetical protein EON65_00535 [archaeon]